MKDQSTRPPWKWRYLPLLLLAPISLAIIGGLFLYLYIDWAAHPNWKIVVITLAVIAVLALLKSIGTSLENFDKHP